MVKSINRKFIINYVKSVNLSLCCVHFEVLVEYIGTSKGKVFYAKFHPLNYSNILTNHIPS